MAKLLITFFLLGLTFGIGPCLLSCGPFLIAYTCGTGKSAREGFISYLVFSLSRVSVYIILGVLIVLFKFALTQYHLAFIARYIFIFSGIAMILIGLLIAVGKKKSFPACKRLQGFFIGKDLKTLIAMGAFIGLAPCAPLFTVFTYVAVASKNILQSAVYSLTFGLGTVLSPLIILIVFAGMIPVFFKKEERIQLLMSILSGIIIIVLGIATIIKSL